MEKFGRFDFNAEYISETDDAGVLHLKAKLIPDPRRYTKLEKEGETYYLDKYLRVLIPIDLMAQEMSGLPVYSLSPTIQSTEEYASSRRVEVSNELRGGRASVPQESAKQHEELSHDGALSLTFVSVDICGSSASRVANPVGFDKSHGILIRELGTLVGQFHGRILKLTGDGFIAYVDHPSFTRQCDVTVDLGVSILRMVKEAINPSLESAGLAPITVRVGADYGEATLRSIRIPATGFNCIEVASDALNRAKKIEESCEPNQFRIGRELYEMIHVQWLERSTEVQFNGESVGIPNYLVYAVR